MNDRAQRVDKVQGTEGNTENNWVRVGILSGSHGVHGDLRLKSFTDNSNSIFKFKALRLGEGAELIKPVLKHKSKDAFVVSIDRVKTREQAQALNGTPLYAARDEFEEAEDPDEFYWTDLEGLRVISATGSDIGVVRAVENFGAEDLLEVVLEEPVKGLGRHVYIPFRKSFVLDVDINMATVRIDMDLWLENQDTDKERHASIEPESGKEGVSK